MKKILSLIYISIISISLFSQTIELPAYTGKIIQKENYTLKYNEKFEQAEWVAYELTSDEVLGNTKRKDSFKADTGISTGSASLKDYKGSGYDRGHLAPAADMKMSSGSMRESFFMSNMSPQLPGFNRGIWAKLESYVRTWAFDNESIYVVTGPVLTKDTYPTIGDNEVAIPEYYYKVIIDYTGVEVKGIGFILPNSKGSKPLQEYAVTINDVEEFTGIDFYPALPDTIEESLESAVNTSLWSFKQFTASKSSTTTKKAHITSALNTYWINSSSMTRHNETCRYYDNTKNGYFSNTQEGKACKTCGG